MVQVRRIKKAEFASVATFVCEAGGFLPIPLMQAVEIDTWLTQIARFGQLHIAFGSDNEPQGFIAFYTNNETKTGFLSVLACLPPFWGTGTAASLLATMIACCTACGMNRIDLHVVKTNARATRFYEKHGFKYVTDESPEKSVFSLTLKDVECRG